MPVGVRAFGFGAFEREAWRRRRFCDNAKGEYGIARMRMHANPAKSAIHGDEHHMGEHR
jgi:hypothetical protein